MPLIFDPSDEFKIEWKSGAALTFKRFANNEKFELYDKVEGSETIKFMEIAFQSLIKWENIVGPDEKTPIEFNDVNKKKVLNAFFNEPDNMEKWNTGQGGILEGSKPGVSQPSNADGGHKNVENARQNAKEEK